MPPSPRHTGPRRGEPKGFCFVEYSSVDEAAAAVEALHGRKLFGRPLRVRFQNERAAVAVAADFGPSEPASSTDIPSAEPPSALASVDEAALERRVAELKKKLAK